MNDPEQHPDGSASMQAGRQPLADLIETHGLRNHDLVAASTEHLNHKQVTKGCKGRVLTRHMQDKILRALNAATGETYSHGDLFNYPGR